MTTPVSLNWQSPLVWIAFLSGFFLLSFFAALLHISLFFPFIAIFGILALILLFRSPLFLLSFLFVVRMSLDYSSQYVTISIFNFSFSFSQLLGLGIALLGILLILRYWRRLFSFPLLFPFTFITSWGLFTLTYSISPAATSYELLRFFNLFVIGFLAFIAIERYRDFRTLLRAIFASSILPILFGLYQFTNGIGLQDENVSIPRIFGTFSHPNIYSLYLFALIALTIIYFIIYTKKHSEKLLVGSYLTLLMGTLLLTYARIAWIALFVFLLLIVLWRFRIFLIPLILLPLVAITFSSSIQDRVFEALHPTPDSSITWRQNLWHDMILKTEFENRELLGSGMDTFRLSSEDLRGIRFGSNDPHNDFVKFYVEGGIIGVLVLALYIGSFFFFVMHIYRQTPSHSLRTLALLTGFVIGTLLMASLSDNIFKNTPVQWMLWSLMGGLLALYHQSIRKAHDA